MSCGRFALRLAVCLLSCASLLRAGGCNTLSAKGKHPDALLDVCRWAAASSTALPDLLVEQSTLRETQDRQTKVWNKVDEITCSLRYESGRVELLNLKRNGSPVTGGEDAIPGRWSNGEYIAILASVLQADQHPGFEFVGESKQKGRALLHFVFKVKHSDNHSFTLRAASQQDSPGFQGDLWIDAATHHLVRLERKTYDVEQSFPLNYVGTEIEYAAVKLADGSTAVLPQESKEYSCDHAGICWRNTIRFENWRKFGVTHRIDVGGQAARP